MLVPQQLVFDLGHQPALGLEDLLIGSSNEAAVHLIELWPDWPGPAALIVGPSQSGKSHLAHVWCDRSGAVRLSGADLSERDVAILETAPGLAIEDLDRGIGCERTLFHLLNLAREKKRSLLLTSSIAPGDLVVELPDLRSRLRAAVLVEILPPDDGLLAAVLVKHFADRQLTVEPNVIGYLLVNMERTMAAAAATVEAIDRLALAARRRVTRPLAAEALVRLRASHEPVVRQ